MASAFSIDGYSPHVIPRKEENFLFYTDKKSHSICYALSDTSVHALNYWKDGKKGAVKYYLENGYTMPCLPSILGFRLQTPERMCPNVSDVVTYEVCSIKQ